MTAPALIVAEAVTKAYGRVRALDEVSFSVPAGQTVALWGHNGAGKSTTLRCLLGVTRFTGCIRVNGVDVGGDPRAARRLMGYVPQSLAYYDLSVRQTLELFSGLKRVPMTAALAALDQVGLASELPKAVGALSGGMRQRLALALALAADPPILLLDEPTANLDAAGRHDLMGLLGSFKQRGKTMIFASHRPEEVRELADHVLWMESGRVITRCSPQELILQLRTESWLRVRLQDGGLDLAVQELRRCGFTAHCNHVTVLVQVDAGQKAAPLSALQRAGFPIADFELEGDPWTSVH